MKCKNIESYIIESSFEKLDKKAKEEMEKHIRECPRCARLEEEMAGIRKALPRQSELILPKELDERTYRLCRAELDPAGRKMEVTDGKKRLQSIPLLIKAAFFGLVVLTAIWAVPLFKEFRLDESLSVATIIALSLIFQNALMLLFSPLLLRWFRRKKSMLETLSTG